MDGGKKPVFGKKHPENNDSQFFAVHTKALANQAISWT